MTSSTCFSKIYSRLSLATLSATFLVDHWLQVYFLSSFIPMIQQARSNWLQVYFLSSFIPMIQQARSKPSLVPSQWLPNFISQDPLAIVAP